MVELLPTAALVDGAAEDPELAELLLAARTELLVVPLEVRLLGGPRELLSAAELLDMVDVVPLVTRNDVLVTGAWLHAAEVGPLETSVEELVTPSLVAVLVEPLVVSALVAWLLFLS